MSKFRKKPVVIEAVQWDGKMATLHQLENDGMRAAAVYSFEDNVQSLSIKTLEGSLVVSDNDWIIKGIQGEFYPCKPDIFDATYETVTDD